MKESESFRFIDGFENYLIGDNGTVYSVIKRKELKTHDVNGYKQVLLVTKLGAKEMLVHRLVAIAFVPHEEGKNFVDHIDGNRKNNHYTNLRWCTQKENNQFPLFIHNITEAHIKSSGKPVLQYDMDGNFIAEYRGQNEAGRRTGISGANISQVCRGLRKQAGGFLWIYKH